MSREQRAFDTCRSVAKFVLGHGPATKVMLATAVATSPNTGNLFLSLDDLHNILGAVLDELVACKKITYNADIKVYQIGGGK